MDIGDAAVVALARSGDSDAFRVLVERHSRRLFRLAHRLTGSEADAEDIVQETFLRAYRGLPRLDDGALVLRWLYRIATNCALDAIRDRKAAGEGRGALEAGGALESEPSPAPGPERTAMNEQLQVQIDRAMQALTPQERAAFVLRHFEGRAIEEIGETLGVSAGATKQAVFRAVQKMRKALEPVAVEEALKVQEVAP